MDDLVDALLMCGEDRNELRGRAFTLGGGPDNAISLRDLLDEIRVLQGHAPRVLREDGRTGDQRWFVADTRRFGAAIGWRPRVGARDGIARLFQWLSRESYDAALTMGAHAA